MATLINRVGKYNILKACKGYVVVNTEKGYECHSHLSNLHACYLLLDIIERKQIPKSDYLLNAIIRLKPAKKYLDDLILARQKRANKQKYVNINKGVMKCVRR